MMMTVQNTMFHNRTTIFSNISFIVYRREEDDEAALRDDVEDDEAALRDDEEDDEAVLRDDVEEDDEREAEVAEGVVRVVAEPLLRTRLVTVGLAAVADDVLREVVVVVVVAGLAAVADDVLREVVEVVVVAGLAAVADDVLREVVVVVVAGLAAVADDVLRAVVVEDAVLREDEVPEAVLRDVGVDWVVVVAAWRERRSLALAVRDEEDEETCVAVERAALRDENERSGYCCS